MAIATHCQTPGAVFHIAIHPRTVTVSVDLPQDLDLDAESAKTLEANLHNAVELVMAANVRPAGQTRIFATQTAGQGKTEASGARPACRCSQALPAGRHARLRVAHPRDVRHVLRAIEEVAL